MFKALLYKLAYPLFAKEVEAYHRLNNAILGINRWCASDAKANLITTQLIKVRDDKIGHSDHTFRERLRTIDKPTGVVTRISVPESRPLTSNPEPLRSGVREQFLEESTWGGGHAPTFGCSTGVVSDSRTTSVTQARNEPSKRYERPEGSKEFCLSHAIQQAQQAAIAIANDNPFRKDCGSHEAAWSGSDDSCSSSSASSSGD